MRRLTMVALLVVALSAVAIVPAVFAWTPAVGCAVDGYGNPWTHGGTVTCRQNATQIVVGSGSLDANGCFSVPIGNGPAITCTIDFNPGPDGDPADATCAIPTDPNYTPQPWDCGPISTGTGPNAITLQNLEASGTSPLFVAMAGLGLAAAAAGALFVWKRGQAAA